MKLFIHLQPPHEWLVVDHKGVLQQQGRVDGLRDYQLSPKVKQVIGVAPGARITTQAVAIPGRRRGQIAAALPYALEDSLSENIEELHFTLLHWQPGQAAKAAIVARQQLRDWVEQFRQHGILLDYVIAEYLLLPQHPSGALCLSVLADGGICLRDSQFSGYFMEADSDLFQAWWQQHGQHLERPIACSHLALAKELLAKGAQNVSHWDIGNGFSQWLLTNHSWGSELPALSVLSGEFAPPHRQQDFAMLKTAATITGLAFVIFCGYSYYEYRTLRQQQLQLERSIVQLFQRSFPQQPYLNRPREQVQSLLNQAGSGRSGDFQFFLQVVTQVTPPFDATIDEIAYRDQALIVLCTVHDLSTLDRMKQAFDQSQGVNAELLSSGARDNRVTGRFKLVRAE